MLLFFLLPGSESWSRTAAAIISALDQHACRRVKLACSRDSGMQAWRHGVSPPLLPCVFGAEGSLALDSPSLPHLLTRVPAGLLSRRQARDMPVSRLEACRLGGIGFPLHPCHFFLEQDPWHRNLSFSICPSLPALSGAGTLASEPRP